MTPDELDAIEAEIVEGDESVDDLAALIAALREAWAQIERFDDVLWKKCEEKVDAEARAEKAEAAIARVRALCDEAEADLNSKHVCGPDCYCGCIYTDKVRAALGGGDE